MQSGKEILSVNKTLSKKYLFSNHAENKLGRLVPEQFLFSKKDLCQVKTSDQHLTLIIVYRKIIWSGNFPFLRVFSLMS